MGSSIFFYGLTKLVRQSIFTYRFMSEFLTSVRNFNTYFPGTLSAVLKLNLIFAEPLAGLDLD